MNKPTYNEMLVVWTRYWSPGCYTPKMPSFCEYRRNNEWVQSSLILAGQGWKVP